MSAPAHIPQQPSIAENVPASAQSSLAENDPLLSAVGIAKDLWADEHADEYVANLRQGW